MSQAAPMPVSQPVDGRAIASLVLGVLSVILFWLAPLALVLGVVGIVLAVLSRREAKTGYNTAGLVISIIGTALSLVLVLFTLIAFLQR